MNFKEQIERDLLSVFHNSREHADVLEFWIAGKRYKGPVILDDGGAQDRKKLADDHAEGIFTVDLVLYVPLSILQVVPKKGQTVEIREDAFTITKVHTEAGEIVLYLEMFQE